MISLRERLLQASDKQIPNSETTIVQLAEGASWTERTVQLAEWESWTECTIQLAQRVRILVPTETKETEEDIRRMFHKVRDKMKNMITLKKKSDPEKFAIPYQLGLKVEPSRESFTFVDCSQRNSEGIIRDLEVQIGNSLVPIDFHVLDIKLNWNSSLLLGRAFLSTVGAVCNMQTNQLCLTLIDPHVYYDLIPVIKPHTSSRRIEDDRGLIEACHCGAEYETEYSESIETYTPTSIDSLNHQKSIDNHLEELIDSSSEDIIEDFPEGSSDSWENDYYNPTFAVDTATPSDRDNLHTEEYDEDYEEERTIEYHALLTEED
ncbi:hypothetical protein F2Q69_00022309 [Brassica cretica]|uniref:Aspartic peptidase DDI1-type domain-containing protein n=1 Tax=Brassica cretica TaxID=69181 RepID=A0A8S9QBF0_BRACR|nr:hypothetical protein F2Q69_00022309 [Brassica cretica]